MSILEKLAGQCEGAIAPDRMLDADIWEAMGLAPKPLAATGTAKLGEWERERPDYYHSGADYHMADMSTWGKSASAPCYTSSIDAAASLVPDKPFPELRPGEWWWSVDSLGCDAHVAYENHDSGIPEYGANAATPALALCAAALRAQADMQR